MTDNQTKTHTKAWLTERLRGRDLLFITLTSHRAVNQPAFAAATSRLIHRLKRRALGRAHEGEELALLVAYEPNARFGFHAHLIMENPYSLPVGKAFPPTAPIAQLIREEWAALSVGGEHVAQDIQPVYDLDGAISYLLKQSRGSCTLEGVDLNSLCLPERSAT